MRRHKPPASQEEYQNVLNKACKKFLDKGTSMVPQLQVAAPPARAKTRTSEQLYEVEQTLDAIEMILSALK